MAVLLFAHVDVLGVAWLRIATAALVFGAWRRPWRAAACLDAPGRRTILLLGVVLAAMNSVFYLAVSRLPLSTVSTIEFFGVILLAAVGVRTRRNLVALVVAAAGVVTITSIRLDGQPMGFVFAFANCALFVLYVVLGHRIATSASRLSTSGPAIIGGIDRLGASKVVASIAITPIGLPRALDALSHPMLLLAGAAVGLSSSVIPYVIDQIVMARLPRASFALMLSLLPAFSVLIGAIVLSQLPTARDIIGIVLVIAGVALHDPVATPTTPE